MLASKVLRCAACLVLVACSANDDVPAPLVGSVTPGHAPPGAVVRIDGDYFCGPPPDGDNPDACPFTGLVGLGTVPSISSLWTPTTIMVEVPTGQRGEVELVVIVAGRRSNDLDFVID